MDRMFVTEDLKFGIEEVEQLPDVEIRNSNAHWIRITNSSSSHLPNVVSESLR